jgi:glycosyltransferase involved in cell wall biosynthesis
MWAMLPRRVSSSVDGQVHIGEIEGFPSRFVAGWQPSGHARWAAFRQRVASQGYGLALGIEWDRLLGALGQWWARRRMDWRLASSGRMVVVFDHAMGGGANRYCEDLVEALRAQSRTVATVKFRLSTLDYSLTLHRDGGSAEVLHTGLRALLRQLAFGRMAEIHINNLVSFTDPVGVVRWARARGRSRGTALHLHLHDYYAICPSWNLIDAWDKFCGVPSLDVCKQCLPANKAHTLSLAPDMDISEWRSEWQALLESAEAIMAFSQSSVEILRRAYPGVDPARIVVRPHFVDVRNLRPVRPAFGDALVIGVIGQISAAKGAVMLQQMAQRIREKSLPIRIVVLGTMDQHHLDDGIHVTGEYDKSDLPQLLEQHEVGVCMLPSVCAETFSYVTAEIMAMRMPLAVFPLGAPAERARQYDRGLVISRIDAATALDEIQSFAAEIRGSGTALPCQVTGSNTDG